MGDNIEKLKKSMINFYLEIKKENVRLIIIK